MKVDERMLDTHTIYTPAVPFIAPNISNIFLRTVVGEISFRPGLVTHINSSFCWAIFSQFYPFGVFVSFVFFFHLWFAAGGREGRLL